MRRIVQSVTPQRTRSKTSPVKKPACLTAYGNPERKHECYTKWLEIFRRGNLPMMPVVIHKFRSSEECRVELLRYLHPIYCLPYWQRSPASRRLRFVSQLILPGQYFRKGRLLRSRFGTVVGVSRLYSALQKQSPSDRLIEAWIGRDVDPTGVRLHSPIEIVNHHPTRQSLAQILKTGLAYTRVYTRGEV